MHPSGPSPEILKAFETLPSLYLVLSSKLEILTASNAYLEVTNKQRAELIGKHIFEVFSYDTSRGGINPVEESLNRVLASHQADQLPISRYDIPDDRHPGHLLVKYWHTAHTPILDESGEIAYIIHSTRDMTSQVLAEQQLRDALESQREQAAKATQLSERLEKLFVELPARIAVLSGPEFTFTFVNPMYQKMLFGRELMGKPLLEALPEFTAHPILEVVKQVYLTGKSVQGKEMKLSITRALGADPEDQYSNYIYQALLDENGNVSGVLSFAYDITELVNSRLSLDAKRMELYEANLNLAEANEEAQSTLEELTASNEDLYQAKETLRQLNSDLEVRVEERTFDVQLAMQETERQRDRLQRFFMQSPAGICVLDGPDLVFELVNPPYQALFPGHKLLGRPLLEALPEVKGQPIEKVLKQVYESGETYEGNGLLISLSRYEGGPVEQRYFNFIYQARLNAKEEVDGILVFVFEVTDMITAQKQRDESQQHLLFLMDSIPQQVWTATPDGQLNYVNQIVSNDFGRSTEDIIGHGWQEFIHPEDVQHCLRLWLKSLATGTDYEVEFRLRMKDYSYVWHLGRAVPFMENGAIKLWMGTNTNMDIQKENEQKKDEFISIASHELKTPLTSIKAFNQLLKKSNDQVKSGLYIKKMEDGIIRLEKLITDLLDVTRINAGKMLYTMQDFNFTEMLQDAVETLRLAAPSHEIELHGETGIHLTGDRFRIEQVVNNFVANAIKYSPNTKRIVVSSTIENNSLIVGVQDFGIGIAENDLNKLFDRYYRGDHSSMRFEGLGLGLFISSEILKGHNGTFWIESELNQGSTFYFSLPLSTSFTP